MHLRPRDSTECRSNDDCLYAIGSGGHVLTRPCGPHDRVEGGRSFTGDACSDPSEDRPHIWAHDSNTHTHYTHIHTHTHAHTHTYIRAYTRTQTHVHIHNIFSLNLDALTLPQALVNTILIPEVFSIALAHRYPVPLLAVQECPPGRPGPPRAPRIGGYFTQRRVPPYVQHPPIRTKHIGGSPSGVRPHLRP